jgi:transposase
MQRMFSSSSSLPDSQQELIDLVQKQASQIEQLEQKVRWFEEQFYLARHKQFGKSSERSIKVSVH